jgi:hypothetical protein
MSTLANEYKVTRNFLAISRLMTELREGLQPVCIPCSHEKGRLSEGTIVIDIKNIQMAVFFDSLPAYHIFTADNMSQPLSPSTVVTQPLIGIDAIQIEITCDEKIT